MSAPVVGSAPEAGGSDAVAHLVRLALRRSPKTTTLREGVAGCRGALRGPARLRPARDVRLCMATGLLTRPKRLVKAACIKSTPTQLDMYTVTPRPWSGCGSRPTVARGAPFGHALNNNTKQ